MPVLTEPLPREQAATLRRLVLAVTADEQRRRLFSPVLHVGDPGGHRQSYAVRADEALDAALRTEVVAALLLRVRERVPAPLVWLTRSGELTVQDVDADWLAAALAATGEAGMPLTMVVATRQGWWDPRSDVRREWRRLRQR
ncbi:MAG: hypothetical protein ACR2JD_02295 [Nocardioides sp.]